MNNWDNLDETQLQGPLGMPWWLGLWLGLPKPRRKPALSPLYSCTLVGFKNFCFELHFIYVLELRL